MQFYYKNKNARRISGGGGGGGGGVSAKFSAGTADVEMQFTVTIGKNAGCIRAIIIQFKSFLRRLRH